MDLRPRHCTADTLQDTGSPALDIHVSGMIMYVSAAERTRGYVELMHLDMEIQEKTGNKNATSHIIQAISMTVQRGNATSIMGTLGQLRKFEDFFVVISPQEEES